MANKSELIMYQSKDGIAKIEVKLEDDTVWLTQLQMAELFQTTKQNVSLHINNAIKEKEIDPISTVKESLTVQNEGNRDVSRIVKYYNLDIIISVGYRVKSLRGVEFRKWATERLKEYLIQGFTMNDEFLKNNGGGKYWKNLLNRIRDIRSSEKVLYRQVLDLYATSVDYNPHALESVKFFKIVQNKLHYATHGNTAAEVIYNRVDGSKDFLGLTNFTGNCPTREESHIAKNYLTEEELGKLNRLVSAFFDLAELKAIDHIPMYMADWIRELDDFTSRYGEGTLLGAGTISNEAAIDKADLEYDKYKNRLDTELSDVEIEYLNLLTSEVKSINSKEEDKYS